MKKTKTKIPYIRATFPDGSVWDALLFSPRQVRYEISQNKKRTIKVKREARAQGRQITKADERYLAFENPETENGIYRLRKCYTKQGKRDELDQYMSGTTFKNWGFVMINPPCPKKREKCIEYWWCGEAQEPKTKMIFK
jgi:hypothetical protein